MRLARPHLVAAAHLALATSLALGGCGTDGQPADSDSTALVIENVTVIDGTGGPPREGRTVVVQDGLITAVEASGEFAPPRGARVIDGNGRFLMPGLIDVHAHVTYLHEPARFAGYDREVSERILLMLLDHGVTTARNPAAPAEEGVRLREDVQAGVIPGPRLFTAGEIIHGGEEDAIREAIRRQAAAGVDFVKTYAGVDAARLAVAVEEAGRHGLPVVAHLQAATPEEAVAAGVAHVAHAASWSTALLPEARRGDYERRGREVGIRARLDWLEWVDLDGPEMGASVAAVARAGVPIDPTLVAYAPRFLRDDPRWTDRPEIALAPEPMRASWAGAYADWTSEDRRRGAELWPRLLGLVRRYHEAGAVLTAGSDLPNPFVIPGVSIHDELQLLHEAGIPAIEVLRIATLNGARSLGIADEVGTITPGKRADLILLDADPLADIRNSRRIAMVIKGGVVVRE